MSILYPYQTQCLDALDEARKAPPEVVPNTRLAVEMATGLGKTITFAGEIERWLTRGGSVLDDPEVGRWASRSGKRVLVLVHTDELVRQAVKKIGLVTRKRWTIGVVKAEENQVNARIIVASVQTIANPARRNQITNVGKVIVDECHHAVAKTYVEILEHFGCLPDCPCANPEYGNCFDCYATGYTHPPVPLTGYTATLSRTDGKGLGSVFQDMAFSRSMSWAIRKGYLLDFVPYSITVPGVDPKATDAVLDSQLADSIAPEAVVKAWAEKTARMCSECLDAMDQVTTDSGRAVIPAYCPNPGCGTMDIRPSTVLFAPLVRSAEAFADAFNEAGIKAEVVHGKLSDTERAAVLDRYESGITTVLCNAMVLTEGWDSPRTMCVIVTRTSQGPLLVQMIGRGVRAWLDTDAPAREDQKCIVLCVGGGKRDIDVIADLSDRAITVQDGKSFLDMEDEWDLGKDIEPDEGYVYRGPVRVEEWDAVVQASSKAWKYTEDGAPYLPTRKRGEGYVFIVEVGHEWQVWARQLEVKPGHALARVWKIAIAPDLQLAMSIAEDEAQELGGDIGALLADKNRPWRKGKPTQPALDMAYRVLDRTAVDKVLASKTGGKAGRLSDMVDRVVASKILDKNVKKIKEGASV